MELIGILILLIILSGFFSGAEVALLSVTRVRLRTFLKQKKRGAAALKRLKDNSHRMIITILIGNNIVNVAAATLTTLLVQNIFGEAYLSVGAGVLTLIILVFGEITPKTFAASHAGRIALIIAPAVEILSIILLPAILALDSITQVLRRFTGEATHTMSEADVQSTIELGVESHVINPHEESVMQKALTFHDITAFDVMTPKEEMFILDANRQVGDVVDQAIHSEFSRFPVFDDSPERITGVVHIKDIFRAMQHKDGTGKLADIAQRPVFVPAKIRIDNLFKAMQKRRVHLVLVRSQGSALAGLVTLEDLLEELVGEIADEHELEPHTIVRVDRRTIVTHAQTHIKDINRFLNIHLPDENETIEKLLVKNLPNVRLHETVVLGDVTISIESFRNRRIRKVRIKKEET
jgi:CBS domain containing-hemolysin-like protein